MTAMTPCWFRRFRRRQNQPASSTPKRERVCPANGQRWLHIGDNIRADIEMGRKHGMSTWYYRRCMDAYMSSRRVSKVWKTSEPASAARSVAQGLIANRITHAKRDAVPVPREDGFWEDFGYATAGPLFVGFTEWLIEQAKARRLHGLYFLAREGLVMQQVYDKLAAAAEGAVKERTIFMVRGVRSTWPRSRTSTRRSSGFCPAEHHCSRRRNSSSALALTGASIKTPSGRLD